MTSPSALPSVATTSNSQNLSSVYSSSALPTTPLCSDPLHDTFNGAPKRISESFYALQQSSLPPATPEELSDPVFTDPSSGNSLPGPSSKETSSIPFAEAQGKASVGAPSASSLYAVQNSSTMISTANELANKLQFLESRVNALETFQANIIRMCRCSVCEGATYMPWVLPCGHPACQGCVFVNRDDQTCFCCKCGGPVSGLPRYEVFLRGAALLVLDFFAMNVPHRVEWFNPANATWAMPTKVSGEPGPSTSST